jgi:hypothetical protein
LQPVRCQRPRAAIRALAIGLCLTRLVVLEQARLRRI